jgi:predicted phosphodiesterase
MRLGLLADIHEHAAHLRGALDALRGEGVDRLVFLGDVCGCGGGLEESVAMLDEAGAVGVWGNHDFGLCQKPDDELDRHYSPRLLAYMRRLEPRLQLGDCLFTHVEPWLDPTSLEDLWWFEGRPETPERVAQSFAATAARVLFVGHFHRFFLASRRGLEPWGGDAAVTLDPAERYLVGLGAVCEGRCAVFDTAASRLIPLDVRSSA